MTFKDVFSQEHITRTLQNQIISGQTVHAYLFTGSRGTGKTTCARILAKALNCLAPRDGNPCLACEACRLAENGAGDISEIDAASNNGVDDVRVLREETRYAPVSLKYRVYIIDEVHMLSAGAFNALLKTLEEPPAHVIFILATTENHKIPATILSRCQRFEFKRVGVGDCAGALRSISVKEGVSLNESAAELIARLSDGGMRDALSLLETCISQNAAEITADVVRDCAGVAGSGHVFGVSEAILAGNFGVALKIINLLHEQSKDMGLFLGELTRHYRNLMLLKLMPGETDLISWLPEEADDYRRICAGYSLKRIMKCLDVLEEYSRRLSGSRDKRLSAEMCVVEMCVLTDSVEQFSPPPPVQGVNLIDKQTVGIIRDDIPPPPIQGANLIDEQAVGIIRDGTPPWGEILRNLPPFLSGMLENTAAVFSGDTLELTDNAITGGVIENPLNKERISETVLKVTGKRVEVRFIPKTEQVPEITLSKADEFISLLKQKGIEVKEK